MKKGAVALWAETVTHSNRWAQHCKVLSDIVEICTGTCRALAVNKYMRPEVP